MKELQACLKAVREAQANLRWIAPDRPYSLDRPSAHLMGGFWRGVLCTAPPVQALGDLGLEVTRAALETESGSESSSESDDRCRP